MIWACITLSSVFFRSFEILRFSSSLFCSFRAMSDCSRIFVIVWANSDFMVFSEEAIMEVRGRCLMTGLPRTFTVSSSEILDALEEVSSAIVEAVHWVLARTPPELTGDISANGITMTGGGSLIWGFDKLIASKTGIPTRVADEAVSCVAYGTGNCLENLSKMQDGTMNLSRQRQMKAR